MKPETIIYIQCWIHIFIWIFAFFAGLISYKLIGFNMYVLLPGIYLIQSVLPTHIIMKSKMKFIWKHRHQLQVLDNYIVTPQDKFDILHYAKQESVPYEQALYCFKVLKYYEHKTILPKIIDEIKVFFIDSFRNPLDAQGMIILGYLFNLLLHQSKP